MSALHFRPSPIEVSIQGGGASMMVVAIDGRAEPAVEGATPGTSPFVAGARYRAELAPTFEAFYAGAAQDATRLAWLLTSSREDAQDVVQEAFVGLFRRWADVQNPAAYLQRSITNGAAGTHRRRSSTSARLVALRQHQSRSGLSAPEYLADMIEGLPHRQRAVVVLRYYLQLQDREIAAAVGMPVGSVGPTLARALVRLRRETSDES